MADKNAAFPPLGGEVLTILAGNRTVSFALFEQNKAAPLTTLSMAAEPTRTADEYAALLAAMPHRSLSEADVKTVVLASVVPPLTATLCDAMHVLYPDAVCLTVGAGLRSGLSIETESPAELGADLVAMSVGATLAAKPPFLVLCCGDVTTLCAVGCAGERPAFLGCAILPGTTLNEKTLRGEAALLSTVALSRPTHAIGKTTADSVRAGVLLGHAAAIDGLILAFEQELGGDTLPVIATGEEAAALLPLLSHTTVHDAVLAHKGLCHIASLNARKSGNAHKRG